MPFLGLGDVSSKGSILILSDLVAWDSKGAENLLFRGTGVTSGVFIDYHSNLGGIPKCHYHKRHHHIDCQQGSMLPLAGISSHHWH